MFDFGFLYRAGDELTGGPEAPVERWDKRL